MTLSKLLHQTAMRYEAATSQVLEAWKPECGCTRPGTRPECEACPCRIKFERLVQERIQQMQTNTASSPSSCIYVSSEPPL